MSAMILTINLQGSIGGFEKHKSTQRVTIRLSDNEILTKEFLHTNRKIMECKRVLNVSEEVVEFWSSDGCPDWEDPKRWKKMTASQRLYSHLDTFDEGFGFSFEFIES
jgi:hypothetical protein